eukprot:CAMPEP_0182529144 /NCGR_PEP_ID=MMETSP1323-20130603/4969_1 /TAXON_ID=236787 /ORGANISM="Florenciella parvula, Strain RCC1693" /LENGTH=201 /DNA_ID=CAMNT_0024738327 /DNA_START=339 /DNA_END=941 /DNA_ORIENTATION=+
MPALQRPRLVAFNPFATADRAAGAMALVSAPFAPRSDVGLVMVVVDVAASSKSTFSSRAGPVLTEPTRLSSSSSCSYESASKPSSSIASLSPAAARSRCAPRTTPRAAEGNAVSATWPRSPSSRIDLAPKISRYSSRWGAVVIREKSAVGSRWSPILTALSATKSSYTVSREASSSTPARSHRVPSGSRTLRWQNPPPPPP